MNLTWALLFINFWEVSWHSQASVPHLRKKVMMTLHPAVVKIQFSNASNMTAQNLAQWVATIISSFYNLWQLFFSPLRTQTWH